MYTPITKDNVDMVDVRVWTVLDAAILKRRYLQDPHVKTYGFEDHAVYKAYLTVDTNLVIPRLIVNIPDFVFDTDLERSLAEASNEFKVQLSK